MWRPWENSYHSFPRRTTLPTTAQRPRTASGIMRGAARGMRAGNAKVTTAMTPATAPPTAADLATAAPMR